MLKKYVGCAGQHTFEVLPGSEADAKYQDTDYLSVKDCPECVDADRAWYRQHMQTCLCEDYLCNTGKGCSYARDLAAIADAPSGLKFLPVSELLVR